MVKEQQHEQIRNAELNRAKAEAELLALKNQVDPHFVFNSLNTLTYLIRKDSATALLFTENLAEVYRYILMQKDSSLVLLEDELEFTKKYSELLKLRFGNAFIVTKNFDGETERSFLIPPTSIFFALENAVKHNEMSVKHPLEIDISVEEKNLVVCNRMRERNNIVPSSKIGLRNLDERFRLLTGKGISTTKALEYFRISMPLVTLN
jgi:LytS/YehU family sensor histidine kinase